MKRHIPTKEEQRIARIDRLTGLFMIAALCGAILAAISGHPIAALFFAADTLILAYCLIS